MADTLVDDFDVVDMLTRLAGRCVTVLGVSAAGVMLASPAGDLRLVASSSEAMRVLELLEIQTDEGPCLDAFRTGELVGHEYLQAGAGRWPRFSMVAVEADFQSVFALPLRLRERTVGALSLFSVERNPMYEEDVLVQAFDDLAAISVVQHRAASETQPINEQLAEALTSRIDRASQRRDLRTCRRRHGRGIPPVTKSSPRQQPPSHRGRPSRDRRPPRPASMANHLLTSPGARPGGHAGAVWAASRSRDRAARTLISPPRPAIRPAAASRAGTSIWPTPPPPEPGSPRSPPGCGQPQPQGRP